jgi:hypothetical protein
MYDEVYAHYGLNWQFWKCDVSSENKIAAAISGIRALGACPRISLSNEQPLFDSEKF